MKYLDITDELTEEGKQLKVGAVLIFDFEGSPVYLKIKKKKAGKVWAQRLDPKKFLTPEEADESVTVVPNK